MRVATRVVLTTVIAVTVGGLAFGRAEADPSQASTVNGLLGECGGPASSSDYTAWANSSGYQITGSETTPAGSDCGGGGGDDDPWDYRYLENLCGPAATSFCGTAMVCGPDEIGYFVERRLEGTNDPWQSNGTTCVGPDRPTVTPALVLEQVRRMGLPDAELQTQPGFESGKTLVNFDTNFYTTVDPVTRTFTLLGAQVTVEATPTSYTWHFDSGLPDGTRTTSTPGAPYPDLDVTYAYQDAHTTVRPSVDVTYSARFSVDGGTWQTIPDTVTIEGEPIRRYVAEASARLAEMN
jgi:hypothetical protein